MRKKISKKLSFSEVNEMTIHEILKAMEITLDNDTDEKIMESDCRLLHMSYEMRAKFDVPTTRQWTYLEKKLNFIILAYAAIRKHRYFYTDWDEFAQKLDDCRYEDTNIINKPYQTICLDYDLNAFTRSAPIGWTRFIFRNIVMDYTNTSISKASEHLSYITLLKKEQLTNFCEARLVNDIITFRVRFMETSCITYKVWYKQLVNAINGNIYFVPNISMDEFLTPVGQPIKRISVADYVVFLLVIKQANGVNPNIVREYLTSLDRSEDNMERILHIFESTYPFNENNDRISICPQEHLLALNNYFKPEYVYGTEDGDNALESTNDSITSSSTKGTISFNVYRNSDAESTATSEDNDCIAIDIEAPINEDPGKRFHCQSTGTRGNNMEAIDLASLLLMRLSKKDAVSFKSNDNASAFWMTTQGEEPIQICLSSRKVTMDEWKERHDLSICTNISIVFSDDADTPSKDDKDSIPLPAELHISVETDNQGEPFIVREYIYQCQGIGCEHIEAITDAIVQAAVTGKYKDPFKT